LGRSRKNVLGGGGRGGWGEGPNREVAFFKKGGGGIAQWGGKSKNQRPLALTNVQG